MKRNQSGNALVAALVVAGVLVAGGVWFYTYLNGLRTQSVRQENALNAQYLSNQNYLSAFISGFYEQVSVADRKSEKLERILVDAVKGRYEDDGFTADGAFFAAVFEAYPELGDLNVYDQIVSYVKSQREGYRNMQDKLLDMLRTYDSWRQDGIVQSRVVATMLGIPSQRLKASIGKDVVYGEDAYERMLTIVLASQAQEAYETGTMEPMELPEN